MDPDLRKMLMVCKCVPGKLIEIFDKVILDFVDKSNMNPLLCALDQSVVYKAFL